MAYLEFEAIDKRYGEAVALDGVTLGIERGELFSLLGPSGCGKTTLLRVCAGFVAPDAGRVCLEGQDITGLPPDRRPVNTVFQSYALFPHLSVADNIAFGLRVERRPEREARQAVEELLHVVRMSELADRKPHELSGGQKQRVAIARALAKRPKVLLLDEPLAALDLKLRQHMLGELRALHRRFGTTFIFVTHDQGEAMSLSTRLAVMDAGRVVQVGAPAEIYERPCSRMVAAFVGDGNLLPGVVRSAGSVDLDGLGAVAVAHAEQQSGPVLALVRPEHVHLGETPGPNAFAGTIEDTVYQGSSVQLQVRVGERLVLARCLAAGVPPAGTAVTVSWAPEHVHLVDDVREEVR
ncbi:MAG: ABC transporter ATP-binding protein [Myxococcales bacterium]